MFRIVASRPVKLAVFGLSVAVSSSAFACPRPGGGGGYGGGYHRPVHYAQPQYRPAPQYRPQPQFAQPSIPPQQMFPPASNGAAPGQVAQPQTVPGQFPQGQNVPPQPQVAASAAPTGQPQVAQQRPAASQPQAAPAQSAPAQTAAKPATAAPATADASLTALQILAGMSAPPASSAQATSQAPAQPATDPRVGSWIARLGNGATVRLELRADGSFVWTATQEGKTSSFQGSYEIAGGSLTLARSSDNQKLAGTLTEGSNGFNFKLEGAKDSGLDFVRG